MTTPRTGWRKAAVTIAGMACLTALALTDHLTPETAVAVGGPLAAYLGVNLFGCRRR